MVKNLNVKHLLNATIYLTKLNIFKLTKTRIFVGSLKEKHNELFLNIKKSKILLQWNEDFKFH